MAVDFSKLVVAQLQDNIIDGETREPAIGQVFFYKAGQEPCLKNAYQATNNPLNPFVPVANPLALDDSGSLPFPVYYYPFDENDAGTQELYDVVVKRLDDTEILRRDNWPPQTSDTPLPGNAADPLNVCPNYEFHSPVNADIYDIEKLSNENASVAWGWKLQQENITAQDVRYTFALLNNGTASSIEETPLNALNVRITNSQGSTGYRRLSYKLGSYNAFQGKFIALSHFAENVSNTTSFTVQLIRTLAGTEQAPINLGTLTLASGSLQKTQLTIQIPDITDSGYVESDDAFIALAFPENIDCEFSLTANWHQVVDGATDLGTPARFPLGLARANSFFQENDSNIIDAIPNQIGDQQDDGLPLTISQGSRDVLFNTGMINEVLDSSVHQANWGLEIIDTDDKMLFINQIPKDTGEIRPKLSRANRLIYELRDSNANRNHSFSGTKLSADTAEISMFSGAFKTDWTTNNATAITLTKKGTGASPYDVVASVSGVNQMDIVYSYIWTPPNGFLLDYWNTSSPFPAWVHPIEPIQNIGNWYGLTPDLGSIPVSNPPAQNFGGNYITHTPLASVPPLGVGLRLTFNSAVIDDYISKYTGVSYSSGGGDPISTGRYHDFIEIPSQNSTVRAHPYAADVPDAYSYSSGNIHLVFTKGSSSSQYLKGRQKTAIIDVTGVADRTALINKIVTVLNGTESYEVKFNTLPTHGDYITFSNDIDDYVLQFYEEGQGVPAAPSVTYRELFPFQFSTGESIETLVENIVAYFPVAMQALPSLGQLGLTDKAFMSYMMHL
jgi:hypothetical protein